MLFQDASPCYDIKKYAMLGSKNMTIMRFKFNRGSLSERLPHTFPRGNYLKYKSKCALLILYNNKLIPCHV